MATQFSMLGIMNAAMIAQGQEDLLSSNDGSIEYRLLARNWPFIVEAELEDGNYSFTKQEATLTQRITGKFGYDYGYAVPPGSLHIRRLWIVDDTGAEVDVDWVQDDGYVYLDTYDDGCVVEYLICPDESVFSANFAAGVKCHLEAHILRAIKEEHSEAGQMEAKADYYFSRARGKSSRERRAMPSHKAGPIARSRFSGSY